MKIYLIVEDVVLATALQAKLSVLAFNVIVSQGTNLSEIVNDIKSNQPDCLILDLLRHQPNGLDLLLAIKSAQDDIKAPIFIYTAQDDKKTRERSLNIGADHFFGQTEYGLDQFVKKLLKIMVNKNKPESS